MCMTSPRHIRVQRLRGFTLIELIIFIVVVGAGMAGILSVMNTVVKSSADPMVRKQAAAAAESVLEEIMQKAYVDPDGTSGESTRATMDDVDDFKNLSAVQISTLFADLLAQIPGYTLAIDVVDDTSTLGSTPNVAAKKVTVTVSKGVESVSLTGYRANY